MIRLLRIFAKVWALVVVALVLVGYGAIFINEGFGRLQEVASPFNLVNFIAIVITLSPALGAWALADKMEKRNQASRPQ